MLEKFESMIFDGSCRGWKEDKEFNMMFIKHSQQYLNDMLQARGWISLNDVYCSLGKPLLIEAQIVGWKIADKMDETNFVDFELLENDDPNITINFKNMIELL